MKLHELAELAFRTDAVSRQRIARMKFSAEQLAALLREVYTWRLHGRPQADIESDNEIRKAREDTDRAFTSLTSRSTTAHRDP